MIIKIETLIESEINIIIGRLEIVNSSFFIEYKESPSSKVKLEASKSGVLVQKTGTVTCKFKHVKGETRKITYTINLNGQSFSGDGEIETLDYEFSKDLIRLKYNRDGEEVENYWKIIYKENNEKK